MSYYGDGRVTSDFVGLARSQRDAEEPGVMHIYFTGSAGNVTAGKYNDGSKPRRAVLTDRVHQGMVAADRDADDHETRFDSARWITSSIRFGPRSDLDLDKLKAIVADPKQPVDSRNHSAMACGWLLRLASRRPILLSRLDLGAANVLHLPGETFVEYQLGRPGCPSRRVSSNGGLRRRRPWYIPLERSFAEGGYEPLEALVREDTELMYRKAIEDLLRSDNR